MQMATGETQADSGVSEKEYHGLEKELTQTGMTTLISYANLDNTDLIKSLREADNRGLEPTFMPTLIDIMTSPSSFDMTNPFFKTHLFNSPSLFISQTGQGNLVVHIPTGITDPNTLEGVTLDEGTYEKTIRTDILPNEVPRLFDLEGLTDEFGRIMVKNIGTSNPSLGQFKIKNVLKKPAEYTHLCAFFGGITNTFRYFRWLVDRHPALAEKKLRLVYSFIDRVSEEGPKNAKFYNLALFPPAEDMHHLLFLNDVSGLDTRSREFLYIAKGAGYEKKAQPTVEHVLRIAGDGYMGNHDLGHYEKVLQAVIRDKGIERASIQDFISYAQNHLSPSRRDGFASRVKDMFRYSATNGRS